jgi:hypothetical protein
MRGVFTSRSMNCWTVKMPSSCFSTGSEQSIMPPDSRYRDLSSNCSRLTLSGWRAASQARTREERGGVNVTKIRALAAPLVSIVAAVSACVGAVWLTHDLRAIGLAIIPLGLIASGLVAYFEWRLKWRRRILAEAEDERRAA